MSTHIRTHTCNHGYYYSVFKTFKVDTFPYANIQPSKGKAGRATHPHPSGAIQWSGKRKSILWKRLILILFFCIINIMDDAHPFLIYYGKSKYNNSNNNNNNNTIFYKEINTATLEEAKRKDFFLYTNL